MVLVYLPSITNRARYIFQLFFKDLIGLEFSLTSSTEEFSIYDGPKINYSGTMIGDEIFIIPAQILFEKDIITQKTTLSEFKGIPVFFGNTDLRASLPFDPFAAGFYIVSRYEEYLPFKGDSYGRFRSLESIVFLGKFLWKPVVNLWAKMIQDILILKYPGLDPKKRKFRFISTIDIDHAYAFGHRSLIRMIGGFGRDISDGNFSSLMMRTRVMLGRAADPYDNYDLIHQINEKYGVKPLYFILFADYGKDDNNVSLHNREFRALIRKLDQQAEVGIHPSLTSNRNFPVLKKEIEKLSDILDRDVLRSRQHFLKISFPRTYRNLQKIGITDDYSMGYASDTGFRAGIADPFNFFDLHDNIETELKIHPVTIMDVSLRDYYHLNRQKSQDLIFKMIDTVRSVDGEFISLWHNETFSDTGRWKGWRSIYEEMLKYANG
jgi:hypothetical protein